MENMEMLAIFDKEARQEYEWTRMQRQALPGLVRYMPLGESGGRSFIGWFSLTAENADAAIQSQIDTFRELKDDFEWI